MAQFDFSCVGAEEMAVLAYSTMPKGSICLELLGSSYNNYLDSNTWTYFNNASVLLPSERHERRVGATLNSLF